MTMIGLAEVAVHPAQWWSMLASWGNVGSLAGGLAAVALAIAAIIGGTAGLGDWRAKQVEQKRLAHEEAESIRLDRQRVLNGWTPNGVEVYGVELVTEPAEMAVAREQLMAGLPTDYVVLRVNENPNGNENRAHNLRQLISAGGFVARPPEAGEYEALEAGRRVLVGADRAGTWLPGRRSAPA